MIDRPLRISAPRRVPLAELAYLQTWHSVRPYYHAAECSVRAYVEAFRSGAPVRPIHLQEWLQEDGSATGRFVLRRFVADGDRRLEAARRAGVPDILATFEQVPDRRSIVRGEVHPQLPISEVRHIRTRYEADPTLEEKDPEEEAYIEAMRKAYAAGGSTLPPLTYTRRDGVLRPESGNHRLTAARRAGVGAVPARILQDDG